MEHWTSKHDDPPAGGDAPSAWPAPPPAAPPGPAPGPGRSAPRSSKPAAAKVGCGLFGVLLPVLIFSLAQAIPRCGGADDLALQRLNECDTARQALGDDIDLRVGMACGQTEVSGAYGHASWSVPVAGDQASGTYVFAAEKDLNEWRLTAAQLSVGDMTVDVLRCSAPPSPTTKPPRAAPQ